MRPFTLYVALLEVCAVKRKRKTLGEENLVKISQEDVERREIGRSAKEELDFDYFSIFLVLKWRNTDARFFVVHLKSNFRIYFGIFI